jgi:hypothetical protein
VIHLPKNALVQLNGNYLTDHNRSELSVDIERIERTARMANGTLRKYVIADKRTYSMSWDMLPGSSNYTVDGKWGAHEIIEFYEANAGEVTLTLTDSHNIESNDILVVISKLDYSLTKRGRFDMFDMSLTLEEV